MYFCLDFLGGEYLFDDSFLIDQIRGAQDAYGATATGHLLTPCSQLLEQGGVNVCNERELQRIAVSKLLLQFDAVLANSNDGLASSLQLCFMLLEGTCFSRAPGSVCLRVAVQYDLAPFVVARLDGVPILVNTQSLRYFVSYFHKLLSEWNGYSSSSP